MNVGDSRVYLLSDAIYQLTKDQTYIQREMDLGHMTWQQAMDLYGTDKPDLRFGLPIIELTEIAKACSFGVFRSVAEAGGVVRALCIPGGAAFTRSTIEELTAKAQRLGAKGMAWICLLYTSKCS